MKEILKKWLRPPFEESDRPMIQQQLAADALQTELLLGLIIFGMQILMIMLFLFKAGGPFTSWRRTSYFFLYILLALITSGFYLLRKKAQRWDGGKQLRIGVYYSLFICLWSCLITFLDQYGGNGLIVYCYMLPTVAALAVLDLKHSSFIFLFSCLILNLILPFLPGGLHNLFSNLINSIFISLLSIIISWRMYRARCLSHLANYVIQDQMKEIRRINDQLQETNALLSQQVQTDPLTGLNNRRYLEETVHDHLQHLPAGIPLAGMMLDIDYFKEFNDHYGHLAGDECLRKIAEVLSELSRKDNIYAVRYGGEEFFVLHINCDEEKALAEAEQLRHQVCNVDLGTERSVTVSIGVASLEDRQSLTLSDFIARADQALYHAKRQGRNGTILYDANIVRAFPEE